MKKNNKDNKNTKQNILNGLLVLILLVIMAVFAIYTLKEKNTEDDKTLSYTDLIKQISSKNVEKIEMTTGSTSIKVTLKTKIENLENNSQEKEGEEAQGAEQK